MADYLHTDFFPGLLEPYEHGRGQFFHHYIYHTRETAGGIRTGRVPVANMHGYYDKPLLTAKKIPDPRHKVRFKNRVSGIFGAFREFYMAAENIKVVTAVIFIHGQKHWVSYFAPAKHGFKVD